MHAISSYHLQILIIVLLCSLISVIPAFGSELNQNRSSPDRVNLPLQIIPSDTTTPAIATLPEGVLHAGIGNKPVMNPISIPTINSPGKRTGNSNVTFPISNIKKSGNVTVVSNVTVTLNAAKYQIIKDEAGFDTIQMEGFSQTSIPGDPMLPHKTYNILVPPEANCSSLQLNIISADSQVLDGTYDIKPAGPDISSGKEISGEYESVEYWVKEQNISGGMNINVYGLDTNYPENYVGLLPYSQMRKWRFAKVDFFPFQYNAVSKKLTLIENVEIEIRYDLPDISTSSQHQVQMADLVMDEPAPTFFINYNQAKGWYEKKVKISAASTSDYVIITTNNIKANSAILSSFITHKENMGYNVKVITEDEYGGLTSQAPNGRAEKIRQWLINNYAPMGIRHVLLIGNPDPSSGDIPMKLCWPRYLSGDGDEDSPTDYFYADLTGNWDINCNQKYGEWSDFTTSGGVDFTPEVYVGRIPVYGADYTTLDNILQKIIDYESASDISWRKSILMPMGFQASGYDGAQLAEQMKNDYMSPADFTTWRMYQQGSGLCSLDSAYTSEAELKGGTYVKDQWASNDYGIVCWWGHGSVTQTAVGYGGCWDGVLFSSGCSSSLDNAHPAFTYQNSCTNGYPENNNNLEYAILKNGGIATVSASRVSWFNSGVTYGFYGGSTTNSGIGYEYVKRLVQDLSAGEALYQTKQSMTPEYNTRLMNWYDFNLYGDPAVSISTTIPNPTITSITPSSAPNTGSVSITNLSGTNFRPGAVVNLTKPGQANITAIDVNVISSTKITGTFLISGKATGKWNVVVKNTDGQMATKTNGFTITYPVPTITGIAPSSASHTGPVKITNLSGTNFRPGAVVSLTKPGKANITATGVNVISSRKITGTFPITGKATGKWNVIVKNTDGQTATKTNGFTITYPTPTVTGISPKTGYNTGSVSATISGTNFRSGAKVNLTKSGKTNIIGTKVSVKSTRKLTCTFSIKGKSVGKWNIVVKNTDKKAGTLSGGFTIKTPGATPKISSITPRAITNTKNLQMTITGANFRSGGTVKMIKGTTTLTGTVKSLTARKIICTLPTKGASTGVWNLKFTNIDGTSVTKTPAFAVR